MKKSLPPSLGATLASGVTTLCTCWRVERLDGALFGFTDHDRPLTFAGLTYEPASGFTASDVAVSLGLAVDTMEVEGALSSEAITEADIALGLWDNARIEIWRVDWSDVADRVILRKGSIGEIGRGEIAFQAEMRGLAHELNQERGRTFQKLCDAVVGDARCGVSLADPDFAGAGAVETAIDDRILLVSGLDAFEDGWFAQGLLAWTSGDNSGARVEVAGHLVQASNSVRLQLWRRAERPVETGDAFTITAGCGKTFAICQQKFANGVNFRGFPHMPGNDVALSVAKKGGENDGGSLFND
ncbi:beta tubulin [Mesorhizobium sp. Root554]|uniref:DUF2163 domain-containing protein n=1 Tax=unclassified Mesorhizobium TaxID=325217 RepID=UPI0006FF3AB4|nr:MULTISPECIES: DUF2163 domain-containing protein [unclassified Mesorhizobium]KQZ14298.1 beta tubulin [Mesorhizobium sp. Root1471]KQZ36809.1 beta tubulin [Mesorhizobium sp. Root554]